MKKIEETEEMSSNEKVCYLGKGSFGIIRMQKITGSIPFLIRKRIQYENFEETPDWRKELDKVARKDPKGKAPEQGSPSAEPPPQPE